MSTVKMPTAWAKALVRFEDGYGDPPDFSDPIDVIAFMPLLEDEFDEQGEVYWTALIEQFRSGLTEGPKP